MIRDLIKWVVPGLVVVFGGTGLCLAMTGAQIEGDLGAKARSTISAGGFDWAELSLDARDVTVRGTASSDAALGTAIEQLALVPGIRSVTTEAIVAPLASPYVFTASVEDSAVALAGGVPDEPTRAQLLAMAGLEEGGLELRSGMPERRRWLQGAEFAIDRLQYLEAGSVTLSDLTISVDGRAKSVQAFSDLLVAMRTGAPDGLVLGEVKIAPPIVAPYEWSASFDGARISITGFVPDDSLVERYRTAEVGGLPVATGLALASGEPSNFAELSQRLIEQLSLLEYGNASITDGESTLSGAPATSEIAQAVVESLQPAGSIVVLEPPRIADYWVSATRQAGGTIVFDGYAPDEATRAVFAQRDRVDTTWLKLGRGAPARYRSGVDFGLAALDLMSEGRIALRDNVLTISGTARSASDYQALLNIVDADAPQGLVLAGADIRAPRANTFTWYAEKANGGRVTLSGAVPDPVSKVALSALAGQNTIDTTAYASGGPEGYMASAETALGLLDRLSQGRVGFDGTAWTITGTPGSDTDRTALEADFLSRQLAAAGWSMALAQPVAAVANAKPFLWSATHTADGTTLMGSVPSQATKAQLAAASGSNVVDNSVVGEGAPEGFAAFADAGLNAVLALEEGEVSFDGSEWSLGGRAESEAKKAEILAALATATGVADWAVDISAPEAPPLVAEAPPAAVEQQRVVEVDPDYAFSARRTADGSTVLSGQVPSDAVLTSLAALGDGDSAAVSIADGAPESFLASAEQGMRALSQLTQGQLDLSRGVWSLSGIAADAAARDKLAENLAATEVTANLEIPALPVDPQPAAPVAVAPRAADIAACAAPVAEFSSRNSILFQSGAAIIAAESDSALDELAIDLAACPDAVVYIEGHTDSDGDDALNMALSVARAEAVVDALVARGVTPARLYAAGYGETSPIADNATAQGKQLNRRIVVTVRGEHF